jgi:hypothetical protein
LETKRSANRTSRGERFSAAAEWSSRVDQAAEVRKGRREAGLKKQTRSEAFHDTKEEMKERDKKIAMGYRAPAQAQLRCEEHARVGK